MSGKASFSIQDLLGLNGQKDADTAQLNSDGAHRPERQQRKRCRQDMDSVGNSSEESPSSESEGEPHPQSEASSSSDDVDCNPMKPKRLRTAFTVSQLRALEYAFRMCPYPDSYGREQIARVTGIDEAKLQVWFQNRRARYRKREKPLEQPITRHLPMHLPYLSSMVPPYCRPGPFAYLPSPGSPVTHVQKSLANPQPFLSSCFPLPMPVPHPHYTFPRPVPVEPTSPSTAHAHNCRPKKFTGVAKRSCSVVAREDLSARR